jgi:hypothetical protein
MREYVKNADFLTNCEKIGKSIKKVTWDHNLAVFLRRGSPLSKSQTYLKALVPLWRLLRPAGRLGQAFLEALVLCTLFQRWTGYSGLPGPPDTLTGVSVSSSSWCWYGAYDGP